MVPAFTWHQKGRDQGYATEQNPEEVARADEARQDAQVKASAAVKALHLVADRVLLGRLQAWRRP